MTVPFEAARRLYLLGLLVVLAASAILAAAFSAQWTAILTGLAGSLLLTLPAMRIELVKMARDRVAGTEPRSPGLRTLRAQLAEALDRQVAGWNLRDTLCLFAGAALLAASFVAQMVGALRAP